ncbi:putative transcription factor MYB-HB-like family [Helianthus annuus]|nr:putative transcription factor MYB-HB-like family [Helianthus annuus]
MVVYNNPCEFKGQKSQEYIEALEEERKKIQVFERELPLCLELVSQAIERCRQQMTVGINEYLDGQSDQTTNECPVLEEFIPMKSTSSTNEDVDDLQQKQHSSHKSKIICSKDWLASAQLSIQTPDPPLEEDFLSKKLLSKKEKRYGCGTFHLLQKKNTSTSPSADTDGGGGQSGGGGGGHNSGSNGEDKGHSNKKERRCWSQELHRRFLHALQQLGGAHVATPKQIREFMKVDGLTNDEIKSHLQKYRLHTRRLSPTTPDTHTPQLVVVGRIWMPPLDYTTNAITSPLANDIKDVKAVYAPNASLPACTTTSFYKTKQCKQ